MPFFHSIASYFSPLAWRQRKLWRQVQRRPNTAAILAIKAELASLPLYELTILNCNRLLHSIQLHRRSSAAPAPALPLDGSGVAHFELCALYLQFADRIAGSVLSNEQQRIFSPALASHLIREVTSRAKLTRAQGELILALWMVRAEEYFRGGLELSEEATTSRIVTAFAAHLRDVLELNGDSAPLIEISARHDGVMFADAMLREVIRLPSLLQPNATVL